MVRDNVPGEAAVPVDGGQVGAGEGSGHVGGGPGGVEAPVAGGAGVPGEAGVIEGLEDGGEDDDTAEAVVTEAAVGDGFDDEMPKISSTRDLSGRSRSSAHS